MKTMLKMAAPLANVLESENIMPSDAILEKPFAHDHENEKLYAFLADSHIREQRKKDKFYETDDWPARLQNWHCWS
ncbi:MAG: hypothetical protein FWH27_15825 [Planctomycetaceae bacterium]|nr:hypothetical protein [Planctomycetaceae bacterium]